ncbi:hypothetical protein PIB30_109046 [Stylosanthes scabra]|uniref:Uncharacterized protein n=1 Tax=Stylosanthes scabra TaxID=79078 RepID=A0ABU6QZX5_9FABA|nr:hypothetical protein [Stylosanthes scabra]
MDSIHATYKFNINPVPSKEYWTTTNYIKTDPPYIKRPIGRPKVHARKRDPVEVANDEPIITAFEGSSKTFRAKQQIRRRTSKRLVAASQQENPIPAEAMEPPKSPIAGPSKETLAAAGPAAQRVWQFMPTPGLSKK